MTRPSVLFPLAVAGLLLLAVACRGEEAAPDAEDTSAAVTPIASAAATPGSDEAPEYPVNETGSVLWYAKSLYDLVRVRKTIVVGRVTGVLLPCDNRLGFLGQPIPDYSDCAVNPQQKKCLVPSPSPEELSRPPGRNYSVYSAEVKQVLTSESLRPGDTIGVMQPGGICVDTPPRSCGGIRRRERIRD